MGNRREIYEQAAALLRRKTKPNPRAQLLMDIPGISYYSALLILSEMGEVECFPDAKRLCSYVGLVPSIPRASRHFTQR